MLQFISQPWPWYIAGPLISLIMFLMLYFGKSFGISSTFRQMCTILGAGKSTPFFNFDWRAQRWNLLFVLGAGIGGWIAHTFLNGDAPILINENTKNALMNMGITDFSGLAPKEIFNWASLTNPTSLFLIVVGGFFVGFGTRYAGGCTSGHAISGLSNLQLPSLVAVIGFFIGGLTMTHFILPLIF